MATIDTWERRRNGTVAVFSWWCQIRPPRGMLRPNLHRYQLLKYFFFVLPPTVRCRFFRFRVSSLYLVYLVLFRKRSSPAERSRPRHSLITLYSRTHHASTSLTIPYQLDSGVFSARAPPRPESAYSIGPGVGTCVPRLVQFRAWRFTVAVSSSFLSIVVCLREL